MKKLDADIFDGSQIKEFMKDLHIQISYHNAEARYMVFFILVVKNFLANYEADNYSKLAESILSSFYELSCKNKHQSTLAPQPLWSFLWRPWKSK